MTPLIAIPAFLLTIGILILIHEYGHYRVAIACGVKVDRFSLGFGRVIWRRQPTPGGTEFVISALPLGGYVRWIDDREGGVLPSERHQTFKSKSLGQRTAIVAAGPIANLLLAIVLFATANWIGVEEPKALLATPATGSLAEQAGVRAGELVAATSRDGSTWREIRSGADLSWELTQALTRGESLQLSLTDERGRAARTVELPMDKLASREVDQATMRQVGLSTFFTEPVVSAVMAGGAAQEAGLLVGDRVLSVDGESIPDAARLLMLIRANGAQGEPVPMAWRVERAGQVLDVTVTPVVRTEGKTRMGRIDAGIGKDIQRVVVRYDFIDGLTQGAVRTWEMSMTTLRLLGKMLIGEASLRNLSGPITIAEYAGQSVSMGLTYYLSYLAIISVSLGVLNLLPLPVLDGGHLMYYLFEAVARRPLSEQWLARLQRGGFVLVLLMMSLALYNDLARQLGLH